MADARMLLFLNQAAEAQVALETVARDAKQIPPELQSKLQALRQQVQHSLGLHLQEESRKLVEDRATPAAAHAEAFSFTSASIPGAGAQTIPAAAVPRKSRRVECILRNTVSARTESPSGPLPC